MDTRNGRYDLHGEESRLFLQNVINPDEASKKIRNDFLSEIGLSTFITETETGCEISSSNIDMDDVLDCLSKREVKTILKGFTLASSDDSDDWATEKSGAFGGVGVVPAVHREEGSALTDPALLAA